MELEIKERDDKYSELDLKFSRLHKRAKQRIQEVQKVGHLVTFYLRLRQVILLYCIISTLIRLFAFVEVLDHGLATTGQLLMCIVDAASSISSC